MRAFLVASGDSYQVMPGGLVRVSTTQASLELSLFMASQQRL